MNRKIYVLNFLHNMERFATQVYRTQSPAFNGTSVAEKMEFAINNEHEHAENLKRRVVELGGTLSRLGFLFQTIGGLVSIITRCFGRIFMLRVAIRIEERAVKDYSYLVDRIDFDGKSIELIRTIISDEKVHIRNWQNSIIMLNRSTD